MLTAHPAAAQSTPQACAAIGGDAERLACYDALFRSGDALPAGEQFVIESERLIPAQPSGRAPATLTVACTTGTLSVMFAFAGQSISSSGDIAAITLQFDQGATSARSLPVSDDNTAIGFLTTRDSAAFLDSFAGRTNLKVRVTPIGQRPLAVDFRLREYTEEIAAVRQACGG